MQIQFAGYSIRFYEPFLRKNAELNLEGPLIAAFLKIFPENWKARVNYLPAPIAICVIRVKIDNRIWIQSTFLEELTPEHGRDANVK